MPDKTNSLFQNENITQSIITISLPMMVTGFVDALYNLVDSIFVGKYVGEYALAALAVNNTIQVTLIALSSLYGVGITSIVSRGLGAKHYQKVNDTIINGIFLCFISTLSLAIIILLNLDPILRFMGSSENVLQYSRQYGKVILWFGFLVPTNGVLSGILRARGEVKSVMKFAIIGASTNIILDALFIIVFGWGVAGAAWATILSQLIVSILLLTTISRLYTIHFQFYYLKRMTRSLVWEIYTIGISNFLKVMTFAGMGMIANRTLAPYGAAAVASFGIINRTLHLAYQPIFGSNLGTQSLIGFNYGANRFLKVKNIIVTGIGLATLIGIVPSVLLIWAPEGLFRLFTDSPEILMYTKTAARITGTTFFLYGLQIFSSGALQAMGHPKEALFLSLFRPCCMVLCMAILPNYFQTFGIWITFPITDILSTLITIIIITKELSSLKKREQALKDIN